MKTHWSIQRKLIASFLAVASFLIAIGAINYYFINQMVKPYQAVITDNVPNLAVFIDLVDAQRHLSVPVNSLVEIKLTEESYKKIETEMNEIIAEFDKNVKIYESAPFGEGEEQAWTEFMEKSWKPYVALGRKIASLSKSHSPEDQKERDRLITEDFHKLDNERDDAFEVVMKLQDKSVKKNSEEAQAAYQKLNTTVWTLIITGFIAAFALGLVISRSLSKTLTTITDALSKQSGDVSSVVSDLASASQELSSASTEQAAALQETASAVEEISSMVNKAAENAKDSSAASDGSKSKAEHGQEVIRQMVTSMGEINSSNDTIMTEITNSNQRIAEIVQVIQEIGSKTKVINDIVFQTKLLSFNASVEAARAGEHGKGFAVVAEEVGNLAQMSGNAAKEISTMLEDSVKKVELIVDETKQKVDRLMGDAKTTVDRGTQIAQECGEVLGDIVSNAAKVSHMVSGIADASHEQSRGVNEISKAIHELNQSTQMNAAAANQCAGSAEQLSVQAQSLKHAAEELRVIVAGGTMSAAVSANRAPPAPVAVAKTKKPVKTETKREPRLAVVSTTKKTRGSDELPDPSEFDEVG